MEKFTVEHMNVLRDVINYELSEKLKAFYTMVGFVDKRKIEEFNELTKAEENQLKTMRRNLEDLFSCQYKEKIKKPVYSQEELNLMKQLCDHYNNAFSNALVDSVILSMKNTNNIINGIENKKNETNEALRVFLVNAKSD